jgi:hypothetical protein
MDLHKIIENQPEQWLARVVQAGRGIRLGMGTVIYVERYGGAGR